MKKTIKLIGACAVTAAVQIAAQAGDLTVNGNLTVTTNSIVNGKVGIGTATPSAALDVRPIANAQGQSGGVQLATTDGHYPSGMFLRIDASSGIPRLAFDVNSAELLELNQNTGNIGIGTTYPTGGALETETTTKIGIYSGLSTNSAGSAAAAAIKGIFVPDGAYGELGTPSGFAGEFPFPSYGVYGHAGSGYQGNGYSYAGLFDGDVDINGYLYGGHATFWDNVGIGTDSPGAPLDINMAQGYARLRSSSSANGSVLELRNDTSSPSYIGAINFSTASATPGQIGYFASDDSLRFRTASLDSRMVLKAAGLYVNGTFVSSSDRNAKENIKPVSAQEILQKVTALSVSRWNYKQDSTSEHIGPMAQDFYAAFKVGPDDKHITTIDEEGVALAAIQGLNEKLIADLSAKESEINELNNRLMKLERLFEERNAVAK
jgi:hypothetical protein